MLENMRKLCRILCLAVFCCSGISVLSAAIPGRATDANAGIVINQTETLVYPFSMTVVGILEGEARVVISIDAEGRLNDALVVGYTNAAFADAAVGALKRWTYEPAYVDGFARASRAYVLFTFKNDMGVMVQKLPGTTDYSLFHLMAGRYAYSVCQLRDLDRIPIPVHVVAPASSGAGLRGGKRTVTVEFFIDEEGKVRVPAIGRDDRDDSYAAAAVAAVEQWRFEPPLRKGRPVLVLARQDFTFVPKS